jgi:solute:Na+ symporter, SSS family
VGVSHMTAEPDYGRIRSLTFETVTPEDRAKTLASWSWKEVAGSAVVLICILGAYLYFRG